jgi:hypothetical protein
MQEPRFAGRTRPGSVPGLSMIPDYSPDLDEKRFTERAIDLTRFNP